MSERGATADIQLVCNIHEDKDAHQLHARQEEEIVVEVAYAQLAVTAHAAVDIAVIPVEEPDVVEAVHDGRAEQGAEAL